MGWLSGGSRLGQALQVQLRDVTKAEWEIAAGSPPVTGEAGCKHLTLEDFGGDMVTVRMGHHDVLVCLCARL